jgi:hypothetical protein
MTEPDFSRLLREPIHAFDFRFMVGDIADYLELSESSLEWMHRRELQSIEHRAKSEEFPPGYEDHLTINADHRFKVSLPLRVRYGALVALITSVEWSVKILVDQLREPLPKTPSNQNETVHRLRELEGSVQTGYLAAIDDYAALVHVRNCVTHNAGIERGYKWSAELPAAIGRLKGFSLDKWHLFGRQVCIERGALSTHVGKLEELVVALHRGAHQKGLLSG